jgi:uncharacterized protein YbbC (DUF1343 family)
MIVMVRCALLLLLGWLLAADARADSKTARFEAIESLVERAIARGELPGCVVEIGTHVGPLYTRAFGERTAGEAMTLDTLFDLASLTKPFTAAAVAKLVEQHKLALDDRVGRHLASFARQDKREITVRHLLLHTSGLPKVSPLADFEAGREHTIARIAQLRLVSRPGVKFEYSDLGYIVLGELIRRVSGEPLERFLDRELLAPLGLDAGYGPVKVARAAPTEVRDGRTIRGVVDDPRAYRLGGSAGHAGLFATAEAVGRFARMLLGGGELDGKRVLARGLRAVVEPVPAGAHRRTAGFDVESPYALGRPLGFSPRAFGHGGYTGTSLWVDPAADLYVVLLSNRVHSGARATIHPLASSIGDVALGARTPSGFALGIDVLARERFARLRGRKVALLTHLAARDSAGATTLARIEGAPSATLLSLLTPEHGLSGSEEGHVADRKKGALPVYSLFGATRRPTVDMLRGVDTLVIDLVDVGARFYTYMATTLAALEVAGELGIHVLLLDRPNPLDGAHVEGPVSEPAFASFVNYHPLPLRHGLSAGELARLLVAERKLSVKLEVVRLEGWDRRAWSGADTRPWVPPSPNLGTKEQALLYPAVALVEGTNVSVGRGTERAFRVVGAPFIRGEQLAAALQREQLAGLSIRATRFVPKVGPHRGREIAGVELTISNADAFSAAHTGLAIVRALLVLCPEWQSQRMERMVAHAATIAALRAGVPLASIVQSWREELAAFAEKRTRALLY